MKIRVIDIMTFQGIDVLLHVEVMLTEMSDCSVYVCTSTLVNEVCERAVGCQNHLPHGGSAHSCSWTLQDELNFILYFMAGMKKRRMGLSFEVTLGLRIYYLFYCVCEKEDLI